MTMTTPGGLAYIRLLGQWHVLLVLHLPSELIQGC